VEEALEVGIRRCNPPVSCESSATYTLNWIIKSGNVDMVSIMYPYPNHNYMVPSDISNKVSHPKYFPMDNDDHNSKPLLVFPFVSPIINEIDGFDTPHDDYQYRYTGTNLSKIRDGPLSRFLRDVIVPCFEASVYTSPKNANCDSGPETADYHLWYHGENVDFSIDVKLARDQVEFSVQRRYLNRKVRRTVEQVFKNLEVRLAGLNFG